MLLDLNDDCLEYICKLLGLSDQIRMAKVCMRFAENVRSVWRHKTRKVEITREMMLTFFNDDHSGKQLIELLTLTSPIVENLKLYNLYTRKFRQLTHLKFPKVGELQLDLWDEGEEYNDEDTCFLTHMFPNVKTLQVSSNMSGKYLWELTNLRDLDLGGCEFLDEKYFSKIFGTLKLQRLSWMYYGYNTVFEEALSNIALCKTLEEIIIDDHHMLLVLDRLDELTKLRRIVCYTRDYDTFIMERLAAQCGSRMERIVFNDAFWSKDELTQSLLQMPNLRSLVLVEDDIEFSQLERIVTNLSGLKELRFRKSKLRQLNSESTFDNAILSLVQNLRELEILDLSNTPIDKDFVQHLVRMVDKQVDRITPLQFYCAGTKVVGNFLEEQPLHKQLKIISSEQETDFLSSRMFACNWLPVDVDVKVAAD